jgi:hypothetical protein
MDGLAIMGTYSITAKITNAAEFDLTLFSAEHPYGHWQQQAQNPLRSQMIEPVGVESDDVRGAAFTVVYEAPDGTQLTMTATLPAVGDNHTEQSASGPNANLYQIVGSIEQGFHVTAAFQITASVC